MGTLLFVDWLLQTNAPPRILQYTTIYLYGMKYQNNICNYSNDLCICCVAIHAPAKGATELDSAIGHASTALQSTFPRRERQVDLIHAIQVLQVSIHVPAKGTTRTGVAKRHRVAVSIHVPAKGTTSFICWEVISFTCFNPRSREGNDDFHYSLD